MPSNPLAFDNEEEAKQPFLSSLRLSGLLSFPPDSPTIKLTPLNVLIGPNGSGKSNLIEAIELLHATPVALAAAIREGGTAAEWKWKGEPVAEHSTVEVTVQGQKAIPDLRYRLSFAPSGQRLEVVDEVVEEIEKRYPTEPDVYFYYRYQQGRPAINVRQATTTTTPQAGTQTESQPFRSNGARGFRQLTRDSLVPDESVL